ncbi:MAG: peptide chain release factor N(5)-glutamine methyltransferase [Proteobacteria bacterium]|nr:peptide chain release factor N(5)-glutamine methyltransferase [Pseudomonadota bacterium]
MTEKQAFELLARARDAHDARVVMDAICPHTGKRKTFSDPPRGGGGAGIAPVGGQLPFSKSLRVRRAARALRRGVPVAKIIGRKWFYALEFETNRHTLDPRPESEALVEAVLNYVGAIIRPYKSSATILDLGAGTGNLICAIVKNLPGATGVGIDRSWRACRVARRNVKRLGLDDKIKIVRGDFNSPPLEGCRASVRQGGFIGICATLPVKFAKQICHPSGGGEHKYDIIVSNPPYIAAGDARVNAGARHDPGMALYAGADGLDAYRAIAQSARGLLKPSGRIFLEIGAGQGDAVREIFTSAGWKFISSKNDLAGIERAMEFNSPPSEGCQFCGEQN